MLQVIQALFAITYFSIVVYLFRYHRRKRSLWRLVVMTWFLLLVASVVYPLTMYACFHCYPEDLRKFFPDGPIGPANVAWLLMGWVVGLEVWVIFSIINLIDKGVRKLLKKS